jgi:hypothetical protein
MSAALYVWRIYFDTSRGCVKTPGMYRHLTHAPEVPGLPLVNQIDYAPETQTFRIQPCNGGWTDMTAAEIAACQSWLHALAVEAAGDA